MVVEKKGQRGKLFETMSQEEWDGIKLPAPSCSLIGRGMEKTFRQFRTLVEAEMADVLLSRAAEGKQKKKVINMEVLNLDEEEPPEVPVPPRPSVSFLANGRGEGPFKTASSNPPLGHYNIKDQLLLPKTPGVDMDPGLKYFKKRADALKAAKGQKSQQQVLNSVPEKSATEISPRPPSHSVLEGKDSHVDSHTADNAQGSQQGDEPGMSIDDIGAPGEIDGSKENDSATTGTVGKAGRKKTGAKIEYRFRHFDRNSYEYDLDVNYKHVHSRLKNQIDMDKFSGEREAFDLGDVNDTDYNIEDYEHHKKPAVDFGHMAGRDAVPFHRQITKNSLNIFLEGMPPKAPEPRHPINDKMLSTSIQSNIPLLSKTQGKTQSCHQFHANAYASMGNPKSHFSPSMVPTNAYVDPGYTMEWEEYMDAVTYSGLSVDSIRSNTSVPKVRSTPDFSRMANKAKHLNCTRANMLAIQANPKARMFSAVSSPDTGKRRGLPAYLLSYDGEIPVEKSPSGYMPKFICRSRSMSNLRPSPASKFMLKHRSPSALSFGHMRGHKSLQMDKMSSDTRHECSVNFLHTKTEHDVSDSGTTKLGSGKVPTWSFDWYRSRAQREATHHYDKETVYGPGLQNREELNYTLNSRKDIYEKQARETRRKMREIATR